jgi:hypothetical protein
MRAVLNYTLCNHANVYQALKEAEEKEKMEAGRELDALIAEKVMGLNVVDKQWPCFYWADSGEFDAHWRKDPATKPQQEDVEFGPVYLLDIPAAEGSWPPRQAKDGYELRFYGDSIFCNYLKPVPFYSTNFKTAWEILEKLRSLGHRIII